MAKSKQQSSRNREKQMTRMSKAQPTSSQVHVPSTGEEDKVLKESYSGEDALRAAQADLITIPDEVDGTNCANCRFVDTNRCDHPLMQIDLLDGPENMCCDYWDEPGTIHHGVEVVSKIDKQKDDTREVGKVAIIRGGKILIGTREDNGNYDFPGGRMKFGEDLIGGTIREVHEETGIELDPEGLELIGQASKEKNDKEKVVEVYAYLADLDEYPPLSESKDTDGEMSKLEWFDMSKGLPEEVIENMHTPLEENVVLQSIGVEKAVDVDGDPDLYPGLNNLEGGALKSGLGQEDDEPNALSDLQDAQELISGIDWEAEQANVDPLTARELAWDNLEQDPLYYRKKRLEQDWTSDPLYKDTEQTEESPFAGEGYNDEALESGLWLDLGSSTCRESGHIGLDLYPYDHGTAVHDLDTGIPLPDASASKIRLSNVIGDENLSDPKALLSEIHRVLMPGGDFFYEGPEEIYNYPNWLQDYPGLVLVDHEDDCDIEKIEGTNLFRQKFTRIATPDPATANDAEPRIGIAQYDMLPADALLAMDATGYYWSDATSSGRGNRLMGYPSQGGLLNKGMGGAMMGSASSATESNHLLSQRRMFKGGPGSGRTPEGGSNNEDLNRAKEQYAHTEKRLKDAREAYNNAPRDQKEKAKTHLRECMVQHQASNDLLRQRTRQPVNHSVSKALSILKAGGMKQIVYCVVLEPDTVDSQGDIMTAEDIEFTAHRYLIKARLIGSGHSKQIEAAPVESFIAPQDLQYEGQNGPQTVKKGSWIIGIKVFDPKEWQKVENGEYTGVSVGGKGLREEV